MLQGACYISFSVIDTAVCCENLWEDSSNSVCMTKMVDFFTKDIVKLNRQLQFSGTMVKYLGLEERAYINLIVYPLKP